MDSENQQRSENKTQISALGLTADSGKLTLADRAYFALAELIRSRELHSGAPLVEVQLADRLGVSRTPLRQAMQKLEGEGLLQKNTSRSYIVRKVDLKEYLQSLRVREALEPEAAFLATEAIPQDAIIRAKENLNLVEKVEPYNMLRHWDSDDEVHDLFIRNCRNEVMSKILLSLRVTTQLFEIERLSDRLEPDSREHEKILDALLAKDATAARRHVRTHIRSLFRFAVQTVG